MFMIVLHLDRQSYVHMYHPSAKVTQLSSRTAAQPMSTRMHGFSGDATHTNYSSIYSTIPCTYIGMI